MSTTWNTGSVGRAREKPVRSSRRVPRFFGVGDHEGNFVVRFKIADCGVDKGVSWTCSQGLEPGKRNIWVCISEDLNQCQIPTILYHEATHANYYCNQPQGPAGGFIDLKDCRKQERAAYGNSCAKESEVECIPNHLKQN